jgi:uncharacterized protein YraI
MTNHYRRYWIRFSLSLIIAVFTVFLIALSQMPHPAVAQDGQTLPWGEVVLGQVAGPTGALFNFQAKAGDAATIEVVGIGTFRPAIMVQDLNRAVLAREDNASGGGIVTLNFTVFSDGVYYIQVLGANNTVGQFTILLNRTLPPGIPLTPNVPTEGIVTPTLNTIYYDFNTRPNQNTHLEIRSLTTDYSPVAAVYTASGETLVTLNSKRLIAVSLDFGPATEPDEVLKLALQLGDFTHQATYSILLTYVSTQPTVQPVVTAEPGDQGTGTCFISTQRQGGVNIRAGGSTDHPGVGQLLPGQSLRATGYNSNNGGWYEVELLTGGRGWVAAFVVEASGNCANLPLKTYGPPATGPSVTPRPGGTGTPTPTGTTSATVSPTGTQDADATSTPPSSTPSPTATTPPPTAPPDANYNLSVPLDSSGSVSDYVSYPNGDTEDRVFYNVTGMNQNPSLPGGQATQRFSVTCSGSGTEYIEFFNAGQTYRCGDTWSRTVTFDSNSGSIQIRAIGGAATYVQWTVVMTATRL